MLAGLALVPLDFLNVSWEATADATCVDSIDVCCESLARWNRAAGELVPAYTFVPSSDQTPLPTAELEVHLVRLFVVPDPVTPPPAAAAHVGNPPDTVSTWVAEPMANRVRTPLELR